MYLDRDTRPPITPQLALRVAIIGGVALVMFGVIFFRLWYLQVLSAVGYAVGRFGELNDPAHGLIAIPVGAAATLGYLLAFAAVSFMLEIEASVSALVLRDAVVTTILNVVIAVPLFGLVRRVIRPVLLAKPVGRRRRAATRETGPLGLRGLGI